MLADDILIFLNISSWIGIMPFYDKKKKQFRRVLFMPIILTTWCACAIGLRIKYKYDTKARTDFQHVWLQPIVNCCYYILIVINVNRQITGIQKLFDTFNEIDYDIQHNLKLEPPTLKLISLGVLTVNVLYVTMNLVDYFLYEYNAPRLSLLVYYSSAPWCIYNIHLSEFIRALLVRAIQKRFHVLNIFLDSKTGKIFPGKKSVEHCIKLHRDCCDLVELFNNIFGLEVLISVCQSVMYIIRMCIVLIEKNSDRTILWFILLWMLYAIVSYCACALYITF